MKRSDGPPLGARAVLLAELRATRRDLRISEAHAVLDLDPDASTFANAKPVTWRFLLSRPGGGVAASAEVARVGPSGFRVSHFRSGPAVRSLARTIDRLQDAKAVVSVRVPELSLSALWVRGLGVLPISPPALVRGTSAGEPWLSEREFFARVAALREALTQAQARADYREPVSRARGRAPGRSAQAPGGAAATSAAPPGPGALRRA